MTIHRKHLGTRAELIACSWLLKEGYEVFRNVSPHGLIDVIAIKNGVILKLDVRSSGDDKNFARLTAIQTQEGGVYFVQAVVHKWLTIIEPSMGA